MQHVRWVSFDCNVFFQSIETAVNSWFHSTTWTEPQGLEQGTRRHCSWNDWSMQKEAEKHPWRMQPAAWKMQTQERLLWPLGAYGFPWLLTICKTITNDEKTYENIATVPVLLAVGASWGSELKLTIFGILNVTWTCCIVISQSEGLSQKSGSHIHAALIRQNSSVRCKQQTL